MTPFDLLRAATEKLRAAGIENPQLEARLLWEHAKEVSAFESLLGRRLVREPLAYITGKKEFWSLEFDVGPGVLIPRPETELMIEGALAAFADRAAALSVLDLGTGSGAIVIAFLHEYPNARGLGIDVSEAALKWARANARKHGIESRCLFRSGDWADGFDERFDLVFANPPYVDGADMAVLAPEVGLFEPRLALEGGPDGLEAHRVLARRMADVLAPQGRAFVEIGMGQADAASGLFWHGGLEIETVKPDLAGVPRCLVLRHRPQKTVGIGRAKS